MRNLADSFEFQGLLCYPRQPVSSPGSGEAPTFYYMPLQADLDRGDGGRAMFSLISMGTTGYLMCTAVWRAAGEAVDALRGEVARRWEILDPAAVQLLLAPVRVERSDLLWGNGSGQMQVLATSATSGMPPYSALFNAMLGAEQFAAVAAATNGNPNRLAVEYEVLLTTPVTSSARLIPQSARLAPFLRDFTASGPAGFRAALQQAIEEGLAMVQLDLSAQPSPEVVSSLYDRLLTRAVDLLPKMLQDGMAVAVVDLEVSVTLTADASQEFHPRLDFALLDLPQGPQIAPGSGAGSERTASKAPPVQVRLDFNPQGAPLAWVRVRKGDGEAVLKPPLFGPAVISAGAGSQSVLVTTGYTDGGEAYRKELFPAGEAEILLTPRDLGLSSLAIDARPLRKEGAVSAQVWVRYSPPNREKPQQQVFRFSGDTWTGQAWLAAPARASLRFVDIRWQANCSDGRVLSQSAAYSGSSEIILSISGEMTDVAN